jgi:hypothetical protein
LLTITTFFHSFIDSHDLGFSPDRMFMIAHGQIPYIHFAFDYPVLALILMYGQRSRGQPLSCMSPAHRVMKADK